MKLDEHKPKVLFIGALFYAIEEWRAAPFELLQITEGTRENVLAAFKGGVYNGVEVIARTGVSISISGPFDAEMIEALPPSVKFIIQGQAGYDTIDIATATKRGIQVSNTPGCGDESVAELTLYLLISAFRRLSKSVKSLRDGHFQNQVAVGKTLSGKKLGIIGMGGIGAHVADRATAFGMEILYYNHHSLPAEKTPKGALRVELDKLLKTSDAISLHLPLTSTTRHAIGKKEFELMKQDVVVVNTARGAVIDEQALVDALDSGKVFSAGIDVYENEPDINPGLLKNDYVTLTPHIGSGTIEAFYSTEMLMLKNAAAALETGHLVTLVAEQRAK